MDLWIDEIKNGEFILQRRNINRGYMTLHIWQNAILLYKEVCRVFKNFSYELKRVVSQEIASVDSVHRNIAEGYCRKSINEYLYFLNIAKGSLGESVSGIHAYYKTNQISQNDFELLDKLSYLTENQLINFIKSIESKRKNGDWNDCLYLMEKEGHYDIKSNNPTIQ